MKKSKSKVEPISFKYAFKFPGGEAKNFNIKVDAHTLNIVRESETQPPEWCKLEKFKCPHCPLDLDKNLYCPLAVSISDALYSFKDYKSYERVKLEIETEERQFSRETSLQKGVSGLYGILMVTSGCPVMGKLKPMVRFHLPFGSLIETKNRVLSMYMLAQYFRWKNGEEPDWDMKHLKDIYQDIRILNKNVCLKIAALKMKDTNINAVVILNNFADHISFVLNKEMLEDMKTLFQDYLS